jgi:hypothetical protein
MNEDQLHEFARNLVNYPRKPRKQRRSVHKRWKKRVRKLKPVVLWAENADFTEEQKKEIRWKALYEASDKWTTLFLMMATPNFTELATKLGKSEAQLQTLYQMYHGGSVMTVDPRFILPPHPSPSMRIEREHLPKYEQMGQWVAQRKFNGVHSVIWIFQDKVAMWDRRGITQTFYKLTPSMTRCLLSLNRDPHKELIVVGEVLHSKAKSKITNAQCATHTIVLFDVIYYGDHLTRMTQLERLALLSEMCGNPTVMEPGGFAGSTSRALVVRDDEESHLWLAQVFNDDFLYHFDECIEEDKHKNDKYPEIEGLVLRIKDSRLTVGGSGDVNWLLRCRKPKISTDGTSVYQF